MVRYFALTLSLMLSSILLGALSYAEDSLTPSKVRALLESEDYQQLKTFGESALSPLVELYKSGDVSLKAKVAQAFYFLSIRSELARQILLEDAHTPNQQLRLQVQWALGRVSSDESVVSTLLDNMRNDPEPLFRDKAACALANDQIHLTESQRLRLLSGLIDALEDEKDDVRRIALQALQIQTGQTKGFNPYATLPLRSEQIKEWRAWLEEYRKNIKIKP